MKTPDEIQNFTKGLDFNKIRNSIDNFGKKKHLEIDSTLQDIYSHEAKLKAQPIITNQLIEKLIESNNQLIESSNKSSKVALIISVFSLCVVVISIIFSVCFGYLDYRGDKSWIRSQEVSNEKIYKESQEINKNTLKQNELLKEVIDISKNSRRQSPTKSLKLKKNNKEIKLPANR
jgi:hypothetical protein